MPLSKEQLLVPRYKVISDYPYSKYELNEVLELKQYMSSSSFAFFDNENQFHEWQTFYDQYPSNFKLLPWWSDRKLEDMPQYYKHIGNHGIFKTNFRPQGGIVMLQFSPTETVPTGLEYTLPATEEEYTEYINQKQQ